MKLHDLRPADGSRQPRTRVGRGIAAGKGKTAGRGTKGQKARAGGSIPPWFEGGQTPLHMRIPKLRGFKNRFKVEYEVVNIGAIGALAEGGAFEFEGDAKKSSKSAPITVNQDILRAVGLVRTLNKPLKILGAGELSVALFIVADAFTASARAKIEGAGGSVNVLEVPTAPLAALGVTPDADVPAKAEARPAARAEARPSAKTDEEPATDAAADAASADRPAAKAATEKAAPKADAEKPAKGSAGKAPKAKASTATSPSSKSKAPAADPGAAEAEAPEASEADDGAGAAKPQAPDADTDEPATAPDAGTPSGDDA
jgi:large subunit ribosomal protein L15